jgi:hypothetical protein
MINQKLDQTQTINLLLILFIRYYNREAPKEYQCACLE